MNNRRYTIITWLLVAVLGVSIHASAAIQDTQDPDEKKQDAPPSLDDLLGLETDESEAQAEEAGRLESERELQRRLDEKEINDAFLVALDRMATSARRLGELFDTGLATQRIQEDILAKLDQECQVVPFHAASEVDKAHTQQLAENFRRSKEMDEERGS